MCRNIRTLANQDPPATDEDIQASVEQFVRKLSGRRKAPKGREDIFEDAVADITSVTRRMIRQLETL